MSMATPRSSGFYVQALVQALYETRKQIAQETVMKLQDIVSRFFPDLDESFYLFFSTLCKARVFARIEPHFGISCLNAGRKQTKEILFSSSWDIQCSSAEEAVEYVLSMKAVKTCSR